MPRWVATVVATLLLLSAGLASARPERIQRFHPLSGRFVRHLDPASRDNVHAVVRYGFGLASGVLVSGKPGETKTGLVLTSEHVFRTALSPSIEFADGKVGTIKRVLAAEKLLDYALLEVELPADTTARAARMRGKGIIRGEQVYSVSATTNPNALRSPLRTTTAQWEKYAELVQRGFIHTLQKGREIGGGVIHRMPIAKQRYKVDSFVFRMPNAPGMSGSPVFSADTHEMVALHWGGNHRPRSWGAAGVPSRRILHDLAVKLSRGELAADVSAKVKSLLDEAARH
jgi:hypothetical protein